MTALAPTGVLLYACRACRQVFPDDEPLPDPASILVDALGGNGAGGRIHQCSSKVFGLADLVGIQADPAEPAEARPMERRQWRKTELVEGVSTSAPGVRTVIVWACHAEGKDSHDRDAGGLGGSSIR